MAAAIRQTAGATSLVLIIALFILPCNNNLNENCWPIFHAIPSLCTPFPQLS